MASRYSSEILAVITADEWIVEPNETTLRMALYGGMYEDTENPSGTGVHYQGRIKSDVVLDKKIGVAFWGENSEIDFGYIDISVVDQDADLIDFATNVHITTVNIYRVNHTDVSEDELQLLATARSSDIGFTDEDTLRFRLESVLQDSFDAPINELYYDDTYPHLEGKPYPIAWGLTTDVQQLLPTVFVDDVTLLYHITDLEINSFESDIYDRGVALLEGTNGFDATTYGFTLNQNPDGKITAGQLLLADPESTSNMAGLYSYLRLVLSRAGIWGSVHEADITGLETAINMGEAYPQFFTTAVVSLETYLDEIFAGVGGWYYVDELSQIHFGRLSDPDAETPTLTFTDSDVIGHIKVEDDTAPGLSTRLDYAENPGVYDQDEVAGYVTAADRILMTNETHTVETTEAVSLDYENAAARDPVKLSLAYGSAIEIGGPWTADDASWTADSIIYTADGSPLSGEATATSKELAQQELDRWWADLYPQDRHFFTFDVQINNPDFDDDPFLHLGEFCTLQSDRFGLLETAMNLLIRRVKYNFSTGLLTIEGWG